MLEMLQCLNGESWEAETLKYVDLFLVHSLIFKRISSKAKKDFEIKLFLKATCKVWVANRWILSSNGVSTVKVCHQEGYRI